MIYTEEDLKQAYAMGYNEAVDDVNAYIESCDEEYDEDYSAVEAAIMNETKSWKKKEHDKAMDREYANYFHKKFKGEPLSTNEKKHGNAIRIAKTAAMYTQTMNRHAKVFNDKIKDPDNVHLKPVSLRPGKFEKYSKVHEYPNFFKHINDERKKEK